MATCPYCCSLIDDSAKICSFCGAAQDVPADAIPVGPEIAESMPATAAPETIGPAGPAAVPKKKSKKWLIPVVIGAVLTVFLFVGVIAGLYAVASKQYTPYLGTYKATEASFYGYEYDIEKMLSGGFTIELQRGGKCWIQADDVSGSGTWKVEDGRIFIKDGESLIEAKIEDGVIYIKNMLDSGLDIKLVRQEDE